MVAYGETQDKLIEDILKNIHIGDFVLLSVDGKFFNRGDGRHERYGGYVASINNRIITLSPSHHENAFHGYNSSESRSRERATTDMELAQIRHYKIFK
ncbi:hypothetical protein J4407_02290 [Candidatus Pacearchaeota archaeon]|nr:hypothetical protein [Candidatus Pacearchaeota archaeon]